MYSIQIINELRQLGEYTCTFVVVSDNAAYQELRVDKNFPIDVSKNEIEAEKTRTIEYFRSMITEAEQVDKEKFMANIN